ncbi:MAG: hypothetical protein OXB96_02365 [Candidatus Kaiserbacteria bacterium]|nr:hypothetical protein [Candidatus Kaiserbacteria bacterium]
MEKSKEKQERFRRLATARTNSVLKTLNTLGHCSNRSAYHYSEEEVKKIFSEIENAVRGVKSKFHYPRNNKKFSL